MFTKKKIKKSSQKTHTLIHSFGGFSIFFIFAIALIIISQINNKNINLTGILENKTFQSIGLTENEKIELEKQEKEKLEAQLIEEENNNKINVLLVGRGGTGNDAPNLTDSIILMSIHKTKNHISMLSIPRDLYVNYGDTNNSGVIIKGKINGLYIHYLSKGYTPHEAIAKLETKISQITNEKIDYFVNIDFNGFIKLVNSLGGIQITVPKTLVDTSYPDSAHGFQTFVLKKGNWNLSGDVALKYARSRKNTGGDFGRSERQQQIIKALKTKIFSGGFISSTGKIKKLYGIFKTNVITDINVLTAISLFTTVKQQTDTQVYSSGLNTTCIKKDECSAGGYLYYPQRIFFEGQSVLLGESADQNNLDNFESIKKYSELVFHRPSILKEKYHISIFSNSEDKKKALQLREDLKKLGFTINMQERVGNIALSTGVENKNNIHKNVQNKKKPNLYEYNQNDIGKKNNMSRSQEDVNQEYSNISTKIIINNIPIESVSLQYLKKYLELSDNAIEVHEDGPKYAKNKKTNIEIIYKK